MQERIQSKLNYLYEMHKKYKELNKKTKNKYDWRQRAIEDQIEILEDILEDRETDWDTCYKEDSQN